MRPKRKERSKKRTRGNNKAKKREKLPGEITKKRGFTTLLRDVVTRLIPITSLGVEGVSESKPRRVVGPR